MEVTGATTQVIRSQAPMGRALKPLAEIRDEMPARQDRERAARNALRGPGGTLERLQTTMTVGRVTPGIENFASHRTYQAVHAYTALERSQEREYVSSVLGVDEYA